MIINKGNGNAGGYYRKRAGNIQKDRSKESRTN